MFKLLGRRITKQAAAVLLFIAVCLPMVAVFFFVPTARAQTTRSGLDVWGDPFSEAGIAFNSFRGIGLGRKDPRVIIAGVVEVLIGFLGVAAVVIILYGGFVWLTSNGEAAKIEKAKKIIINGVIGILIVLSAFAIALYVMRVLLGITTGNAPGISGSMDSGESVGGLGALGSGIVRSVYPAPNQLDVPRNTSIMVTFKEPIDPATICDKLTAGKCAPDAKIMPKSFILQLSTGVKSPTVLGNQPLATTTAPITDVAVRSADNLTFIFSPAEYLGNPDGKTWYGATLTSQIKKPGGKDAFGLGGFTWRFEVSNKLDLEPPRVVTAELFPPADNTQDSVGSVEPAKQASALITVKDQPRAKTVNSLSYIGSGSSVAINVPNPNANDCDGKIDIVINNTAPLSANINYNGISGKVNDPLASIANLKLETACGFTVEFDPGLVAGMSWAITAVSQREPDVLVVASSRYSFTGGVSGPNEIAIGKDQITTAANIVSVLASDTNVTAAADGNKVTITARLAGSAGNRLPLNSSSSGLIVDPFVNGADQAKKMNVQDAPDQPKNALIQINFNESIDPVSVTGASEALKDVIRVVDAVTNTRIDGTFSVGNQYRTVEFTPSQQCGANGCGEPVYCLPPNSNLRVELMAPALTATCADKSECAKRAPFSDCRAGYCFDPAALAIYPAGRIGSGITDLAGNSLDGNGDGKAEGPKTFYVLNAKDATKGDNFAWSFWISDLLDITPPTVVKTDPPGGNKGTSLESPISLEFSKVMSASTLTSGSRLVTVDGKEVRHQLVNLRSMDKQAVGYWIEKSELDTDSPADGRPDHTVTLIKHQPFAMSIIYRAQAGSGIRDIYQNCFKPCAGTGCLADAVNSSCCLGLPGKTDMNGNCP